jgi:thioredoxin 1
MLNPRWILRKINAILTFEKRLRLIMDHKEVIYMAIVNVTDMSFSQEVEKSGTVLVDFWAPWCGPCKMIAPVLEEIDSEIGDKLKVTKINVDENQETAGRFGVMSIPTLLVFKDGSVVDKIVGFQPKEALLGTLNKHL